MRVFLIGSCETYQKPCDVSKCHNIGILCVYLGNSVARWLSCASSFVHRLKVVTVGSVGQTIARSRGYIGSVCKFRQKVENIQLRVFCHRPTEHKLCEKYYWVCQSSPHRRSSLEAHVNAYSCSFHMRSESDMHRNIPTEFCWFDCWKIYDERVCVHISQPLCTQKSDAHMFTIMAIESRKSRI